MNNNKFRILIWLTLSFALSFLFLAQNVSAAIYDTAGADTFTVPAGVTSIQVKVWGAGGGGGASSTSGAVGGGGAGGGSIEGEFSVSPDDVFNIYLYPCAGC